jgi:peptidoglycan hydrolase-like protein with peptidoglycan-binding domain
MISGVNTRYVPTISPRSTTPSAPVAAPVDASPAASPVVPLPATPASGPGAAGILDGIKSFFSAIGAFFVSMWQKLTGKQDVVPAGLTPTEQAMASQYGLLPTRENVQAFLSEIQTYTQSGPGGFKTIGPGCTDTSAVRQAQEALTRLGFPVTVTGSYDTATQEAVKGFKVAQGLRQSYRLADGKLAVNEYLDLPTFQKMVEKLTPAATQPTPAPAAQPSPAPQPAPATQPAVPVSVSVNIEAIATQYSLLPSQENVEAFLTEVRSYAVPDAQGYTVLGPGSTDRASIQAIQEALGRTGFPVTASGEFDASTQQAVIAFKTLEGLKQTYRSQDGNFAINEYLDRPTLARLSSMV